MQRCTFAHCEIARAFYNRPHVRCGVCGRTRRSAFSGSACSGYALRAGFLAIRSHHWAKSKTWVAWVKIERCRDASGTVDSVSTFRIPHVSLRNFFRFAKPGALSASPRDSSSRFVYLLVFLVCVSMEKHKPNRRPGRRSLSRKMEITTCGDIVLQFEALPADHERLVVSRFCIGE